MTRQPAPVSPPVVLTVAGSDSGGGAGIQADLKTIEACGGFGTSAVTSVTAQNTTGVERTHVLPVEEIAAQVDAVTADFDVEAVKTGMLATADVVELAADRIGAMDVPAVVDPVMVAASGDRLLAEDAETAYETLIAEATLVTPNTDEAAVLTGIDPTDEAEARAAGEALVEMGATAALVKGGHVPGAQVRDVLVTDETVETFSHERVDTDATHGSGCTLSSGIATRLAAGDDLTAAVGAGIDLLGRAVRYNLDVGEGPGSVHHLVAVRDAAAHDETVEAVEAVVDAFVDRDAARRLVPEVGTNVVGVRPYGERPDETVAVEGRITKTQTGARPNRGVRSGASTHVARFLLAAREFDADLRFAANLRYDDAVEDALGALDGEIAVADRANAPAAIEQDGRDMAWGARRAFEAAMETPVAVVVHGGHGREPLVTIPATDPDTLVDRFETLLRTLPE